MPQFCLYHFLPREIPLKKIGVPAALPTIIRLWVGSSFDLPGPLGLKYWTLTQLKLQGVLIPSWIFIRME